MSIQISLPGDWPRNVTWPDPLDQLRQLEKDKLDAKYEIRQVLDRYREKCPPAPSGSGATAQDRGSGVAAGDQDEFAESDRSKPQLRRQRVKAWNALLQQLRQILGLTPPNATPRGSKRHKLRLSNVDAGTPPHFSRAVSESHSRAQIPKPHHLSRCSPARPLRSFRGESRSALHRLNRLPKERPLCIGHTAYDCRTITDRAPQRRKSCSQHREPEVVRFLWPGR